MFFVPRKAAEPIHIIDVQVDRIAGDLKLPEGTCQFLYPALRVVAPFGLMETQGPQRGQFRGARQVGVGPDDPSDFRAVEKIIVHLTPVGPETGDVAPLVGKVKMGTEGIVKEHPVGNVTVKADKERHRLVERILVLGIGILVGHPVMGAFPLQVGVRGLVPHPVK